MCKEMIHYEAMRKEIIYMKKQLRLVKEINV